jgi:hypothetical protein
MSTKEVLVLARNLISGVGWCQGKSTQTDTEGKVVAFCMVGAVGEAIGIEFLNIDSRIEAKNLLRKAIGGNIFRGIVPLCEWNDNANRTKEEVLEVFDEAINLAEEGT